MSTASTPRTSAPEAVKAGFGDFFKDKMDYPVLPLGGKVGELTEDMAKPHGLGTGYGCGLGNIDAHVQVAGVNAVRPGQLTAIMGTSSCYVVNHEEYRDRPGVFGTVYGGAVDGLWGSEGGQTAGGDIFAWFTENCVPEAYAVEARERGISVHQLMVEKVEGQDVGEHGLPVTRTGTNGNLPILADAKLSGLIMGLTLTTRPEEIYRALLEATCFWRPRDRGQL